MTELIYSPPSRLSGFSACKKAEAAVVNIVDQCKPEEKCVTPNHTSPSSTVR